MVVNYATCLHPYEKKLNPRIENSSSPYECVMIEHEKVLML